VGEAAVIRQFSALQIVYGVAGLALIASGSRYTLAEVADVVTALPLLLRAPLYRWWHLHRGATPTKARAGFTVTTCSTTCSATARAACMAAWCGQDGPAAERWGAQLRRTGTLATGARACHFRYGTGPPAGSRQHSHDPPPSLGHRHHPR
jgi:hypothetical protein